MRPSRRDSLVVSTANNNFTAELYQAVFPKASSSNLILSPFSVSAVLGMVGVGARGTTRTEIFETLQFAEKESRDAIIGKSFNQVISGFQNNESFTLCTANRIYSQVGIELSQDFVEKLKEYFLADFEQLDLSMPEKCRESAARINGWVNATTNGKIENIISENELGPSTSLVVVNGIYFRGVWQHQFSTEVTTMKTFRVSSKKEIKVDTMYIKKKFAYGRLPELDAEAVALPYRGGRLSMIIILPKKVDGLTKIQDSIGSILEGGKSLVGERLDISHPVRLNLPKFKIKATFENLKQVLEDLGMIAMFDEDEADFSGIPKRRNNAYPLFISIIKQKAYIEVREEGTEAAAVTKAEVLYGSSGRPTPRPKEIQFKVDHPFYFQIVDHNNNDMVLFSGHCNDPSSQ